MNRYGPAPGLNRVTVSVTSAAMRRGPLTSFRAVTLLVALGIGLLGQVVAAMAMPSPMQMPEGAASLNTSGADTHHCPACPEQGNTSGDPATSPTCALAFCSALPAVLPSAPIVAPVARAIFPPSALQVDTGITVGPDLGPPRPTYHR